MPSSRKVRAKRKSSSWNLSVQCAAATDSGPVRQNNEDAYSLLPEQQIFIVSDGMGALPHGETASNIVVEILPRLIAKALPGGRRFGKEKIFLALRDAIVSISREIRKVTSDRTGLSGMGATAVLSYIRGSQAYVAHMGDSRAYLYRGQRLRRLTNDHSIVALLLREREITPEQAADHPARGLLSRYVGMEGSSHPDIVSFELQSLDRLLLCTDGLTGMVEDPQIARMLASRKSPEETCKSLVEAALKNGGNDNVTVVVIDVSLAKS